jgi:tetratricopeptide (TPR) repeat protein
MNLFVRTALFLGTLAMASTACSRNDIEAINLANEGDGMVKVDPDGAISKYEQATKLDPQNDAIFYKLALAYEKKEAWDKVASTMATALRIKPKNATYWFKRGKALRMQAEKGPTSWDEAKEPLQKCIQADPNFDDCYYHLGEVMLQTDDEQSALENWTKAVQHNPKELVFYGPLAELYINLGYFDQALAVTKEGLTFGKEGSTGLVSLYVLQGAAYQSKGDLASAAASLEKAKASDAEGQHPEILFNLGSTYAVMTPPKKQEALQMLKAFSTKGCKGPKAARYKAQCDQTQTLMMNLGGSAQLLCCRVVPLRNHARRRSYLVQGLLHGSCAAAVSSREES